jgi:hypothetical protein
MTAPTGKVTNKKELILNKMRNLIADNRDKLFKRDKSNAIESRTSSSPNTQEEVIEGEEVSDEGMPF